MQRECVKCSGFLLFLLFATTCVGVTLYFLKQRRDHANDFSYSKFIFGTLKCEHMDMPPS